MTPAARVAAAIEVLDLIFDGATPEKALTGWGRTHRFAGSKDRAAIRDHVFDALRCRASYGWIGGGETGRAVMLGAMRVSGQVDDVFSGIAHAPPVVDDSEVARDVAQADRATRTDMPDWLLPHFDRALGADAEAVLDVLKSRAGVFLRVNALSGDVAQATAVLAEDGISVVPVSDVKNALQVTENERRVALSAAYQSGLVELQDASSQRAINELDLRGGMRVLDLCAGGGGKALAMAAMGADVTAHDIDPRRMVDIEPRAARAGVEIAIVETDELATLDPFDLVLIDAPCSGSGTWRRTPMAKWDLTPDRLAELCDIQAEVLAQGAAHVRKGGTLIYATCSIFNSENSDIIQAFVGGPSRFEKVNETVMLPHAQGDGFYVAQMRCGDA